MFYLWFWFLCCICAGAPFGSRTNVFLSGKAEMAGATRQVFQWGAVRSGSTNRLGVYPQAFLDALKELVPEISRLRSR
jgi:hypothetical protein